MILCGLVEPLRYSVTFAGPPLLATHRLPLWSTAHSAGPLMPCVIVTDGVVVPSLYSVTQPDPLPGSLPTYSVPSASTQSPLGSDRPWVMTARGFGLSSLGSYIVTASYGGESKLTTNSNGPECL